MICPYCNKTYKRLATHINKCTKNTDNFENAKLTTFGDSLVNVTEKVVFVENSKDEILHLIGFLTSYKLSKEMSDSLKNDYDAVIKDLSDKVNTM